MSVALRAPPTRINGAGCGIGECGCGVPGQAGEGEDGRMKSAIGIGALLMDGLGDTIRVSLTEDPELEIVPCRCAAPLSRCPLHGLEGWALRACLSWLLTMHVPRAWHHAETRARGV